ncbi:MAG: T9SS type A sorting domain-containing protein [Flavobacteriales bacterium]|nr:T9SS type A sorting domain-containing protein [Flavobacteriales bacterium]
MQSSKALLSYFTLIISTAISAQSWHQAPDFPGTARDDGSAFTVGDVAYFGTGLEVGWNPTRDFYAFSVSDGWYAIAPLPEGMERQYACGCASGGYGYIFGGVGSGDNYFNDLWRYSPDEDAWTAMAPHPGAGRSGMACFSMNDKLYFVGGRIGQGNHTAESWIYHTADNTWEQIADYPGGGVWRMQAGVHGATGERAVFTGTGMNEDGSIYSGMYTFLEASDGWSTTPVGVLPGGGRIYASMGRYMGDAVIFGGQDEDGDFLNDFKNWEWVGLNWNELAPLPSFERRGGMMTSIGPHIIYTTGLNADLERIKETWTTTIVTNIDRIDRDRAITLYPNPGSGQLRIQGLPDGISELRFFSLDGKMVYSAQVDRDGEVSTAPLPKGMYIAEITMATGEVERRKWVKE